MVSLGVGLESLSFFPPAFFLGDGDCWAALLWPMVGRENLKTTAAVAVIPRFLNIASTSLARLNRERRRLQATDYVRPWTRAKKERETRKPARPTFLIIERRFFRLVKCPFYWKKSLYAHEKIVASSPGEIPERSSRVYEEIRNLSIFGRYVVTNQSCSNYCSPEFLNMLVFLFYSYPLTLT